MSATAGRPSDHEPVTPAEAALQKAGVVPGASRGEPPVLEEGGQMPVESGGQPPQDPAEGPPQIAYVDDEHHRNDGLPRIGLAIIAKDEADQIGNLLDSVGFTEQAEGWDGTGEWRPEAAVDFVVVCDTGSTDDTKAIAAARGCKVIDFEWVDDFSKARQASFDALPDDIDFTLWADCDDVLENAQALRMVGASMPSHIAATIHRYNYAQDPAGNCVTELWRERLVRKGVGHWMLPVHEVLQLPPGAAQLCEEVVWHHHPNPEKLSQRDPDRNYKILRADYDAARARGEEPSTRTVGYLGTEAMMKPERIREAEELFREYLARPDADLPEERCQIAHKLSVAIRHGEGGTERLAESAEAGHRALQERPDWPDGYLDLAEIALLQNDFEGAVRWAEVAERLDPPKTMLIINPMEYTYQPKVTKAQALASLGRLAEAEENLNEALRLAPYMSPLHQLQAKLAGDLLMERTLNTFLEMRETLVRHDENLKALKLLECVPYFAENQPAIHEARLIARENVLHATDPEVYGSYYRENPNEAPFELQRVPIPEAHETFHRVKFLRDGLEEQTEQAAKDREDRKDRKDRQAELRILDLTCNDGWMLLNLAHGGFGTRGTLDGMEMNVDASNRARQRQDEAEVEWPGRIVSGDLFTADEHFEPGSYDAVVCFETIEHVPDPRALMKIMAKMVKPGGRIYVSTPDGAFERGNVPGWMIMESKGHLRAISRSEFATYATETGRIEDMDVTDRVQAVAVTPRERSRRINFVIGAAEAAPEKIMAEGMGGSETAVVKVSEHFARRGYDVRVYGGLWDGGVRGDGISIGAPPTEGQVLYLPITAWKPGEPAQATIVSRWPRAFDFTINSPNRILWLHDATYGAELTKDRLQRTTDVWVLSEAQKNILLDEAQANGAGVEFTERVWITRNGIETSLFKDAFDGERKPIVVYSSSPDRGLDVLLRAWPRVRKAVKGAELHHFYAPVYDQMRDSGAMPHLVPHSKLIEELSAKTKGVVSLGPQPQHKLAEVFKHAKVWAYPSWQTPGAQAFPEISCISAMEAQAGGLWPVYHSYAALKETVQWGTGLNSPQRTVNGRPSDEWIESLASGIIGALTEYDETDVQAHLQSNHEWAMNQDWSGVVDTWELRLFGRTSEKELVAEEASA